MDGEGNRAFSRSLAVAGALAALLSTPPAHAAVRISIPDAGGAPGETVAIGVRLASDGEAVAGLQADLSLDPHVAVVVARDAAPDCDVDTRIGKGASAFAFRPAGCDPQRGECGGVRALIFAVDNVDPIPSGADLFSCRVAIAADAPAGSTRMSASDALYAPPRGHGGPAAVEAGAIEIRGAAVDGNGGRAGCQASGDGGGVEGWLLLAAAALLAVPRRTRVRPWYRH